MSAVLHMGKICEKHPELQGARYRSSCPACRKEYHQAQYFKRKDEILERNRRWVIANPEQNRKRQREWRKANRDVSRAWVELNYEKTVEYARQWRDANRAKVREYHREWAQRNPEKITAKTVRRDAKKIQATPSWANVDHIIGIYELCGLFRKIGVKLEVDHIVPLRSTLVCGLHVEYNLQLMPARDNVRKGNRWWPDMPT